MKCTHPGCNRDVFRVSLCSTHYEHLSRKPVEVIARSWEEGARSARLQREEKARCIAAMRSAGETS